MGVIDGAAAPAFVEIPGYVYDVSLRIGEGAGITEGYLNFGLITNSFADHAVIHYPWRGVVGAGAASGQVLVVRREGSTRLGVFDTLTAALVALSHTCTLPDFTADRGADPHEEALRFFEHCVALGVACPRSQPEATRRERENIREALGREREAAAN